jgi:sialate O-acetylesterase
MKHPVAVFCLSLAATAAVAHVEMPGVFGDGMVLQRDSPIAFWGRAEVGEAVTVRLGEHEVRTQADTAGSWRLELPAHPAGGPHTVTVTGNNSIEFDNVLIGEVWICSGQSNMEWPLERTDGAEAAIEAAGDPLLRGIQVRHRLAGMPARDIEGEWQELNPETVAAFSAVAYYFGRELRRELDVPVGLIDTSWGGSRIEPWTPPGAFATLPALREIGEEIDKVQADYREQLGPKLDALDAWIVESREALAKGGALQAPPRLKHPLSEWQAPTALYHGMVHPFVPYTMRGAIWYQGESNLRDGSAYLDKMKALVGGWRQVWGQGDFPFYFVQLAPFAYGRGAPVTALPTIWEAQADALAIAGTGMAVTTDIGNLRDIHPGNKLDVGKRLSLWALARTYGRDDLVHSGPLYRSMEVEGGRIRLHFDHTGGGLVSRDGEPLRRFEIAGDDREYVAAEAKIDGDTVVVWSAAVSRPSAVRFGWHQEAQPNLSNREGLPASPFRTHREPAGEDQ